LGPHTPLGELTAVPRLLAGIQGGYLKGEGIRKVERGGEGRQNDLCPWAPETLAPPLTAGVR